MGFERGESVVWRSRPQAAVGYVMPVVVVEDQPDVIVLFQPHGVVCQGRSGPRDGPQGRCLVVEEWDGSYVGRVWDGPSTLRLHVPGSSFSVLRSWDPQTDEARGWYINLEVAWRRTRIGFDSQDLVLDLVVADDLSSWAWKDEDELHWQVDRGRLDPSLATLARDEGERVINLIEDRAWPFSSDWTRWRPDSHWAIPQLPEGWDDVTP